MDENFVLSLIGTRIPDLTLEAYHKDEIKKINIRSFDGRWLVLFFYPADFTFICPTELGALADLYKEFGKNNAEVLSVSTDTVYAHKAWHDTSDSIKKITFPMIADPSGALCKALRTYLPAEGISLRATVIVDPDEIIRAYEAHDNSIGRNVDEVLRKVQAAAFVREHGGQVCPAGWRPGQDTLRPGLGLVGKI